MNGPFVRAGAESTFAVDDAGREEFATGTTVNNWGGGSVTTGDTLAIRCFDSGTVSWADAAGLGRDGHDVVPSGLNNGVSLEANALGTNSGADACKEKT